MVWFSDVLLESELLTEQMPCSCHEQGQVFYLDLLLFTAFNLKHAELKEIRLKQRLLTQSFNTIY